MDTYELFRKRIVNKSKKETRWFKVSQNSRQHSIPSARANFMSANATRQPFSKLFSVLSSPPPLLTWFFPPIKMGGGADLVLHFSFRSRSIRSSYFFYHFYVFLIFFMPLTPLHSFLIKFLVEILYHLLFANCRTQYLRWSQIKFLWTLTYFELWSLNI